MEVVILSISEKIWGGAQIYIESLCNFLNRSKISAVIASPDPSRFNCPTFTIRSLRQRTSRITRAVTVSTKLKRMRSKVIILNDLSTLWLAPLFRLFRFKVIALLHLELKSLSSEGFGHSRFQVSVLRFSSLFAHKILSVGHQNVRQFPVSVEFVGNFVPSWFFSSSSESTRKYDLGFVSRFAPEKNIPLFLRLCLAMRETKQEEFSALMVGDGPEREWLRTELFALGLDGCIDVQSWAKRTDLPRIYRDISCLAITSFHEGFPTTSLEAHAQAVPIASVTSAGYVPEFISSKPATTGVIFDAQNADLREVAREILTMSKTSENIRDACVEKSRRFEESRVLGQIRQAIVSLISTQ